jgi:4-hydroxy-tetrahydrodipicolinate reductase
MLQVLLNGARGRMGQAIQTLAAAYDISVRSAIDMGDDAAAHIAGCEMVIDFSFHTATLPLVELAARHGKPVVVGTTGHSAEERERIVAHAKGLPMVFASNYSVGVNLLFHLAGLSASILGPDYHPEVLELHHRHKKDAPSGTAESIAEEIRKARGLGREQTVYGRHGISGERPDDQVGVHAIRGGDIVGEHTVFFCGQGERIELTHRATDRRILAQGALRAAKWLQGKPAGLYDMRDVLGLK